ncbi:HyfD,B,F-like protein [Candidatus Methanoplasma termitum]|uniref:FpoM2 protein n=1 Tax=Candidatus Methanoplasma termitum TaxID=1577791 RepID=A0A0A7LEK9_9ARCH|nr:HyfD,B,F-like protein [Candidatus Methanoplasma termitum]
MFSQFIEVYLSILFVPVFAGLLIGIVRHRIAKYTSTAFCLISCAAGISAYPMFLWYGTIEYTLPIHSAWGSYSVLIDGITSMMITVSSVVFFMIILHMVRSGSAPDRSGYYALMCALFLSCVLAMCANNVLLLLISWEMITLTTFLMAYSKRGDGARWKFLVITHFGGLMIVSAFLIMFTFAGTDILSDWNGIGSDMGALMSCVVAALLFLGFGTKLGLVPFHVWMSDLYAKAPTYTSAMLSTVSSNVAVLILLKGIFRYLGVGEDMYVLAILLMVLSSMTAIWGALESLIQTEPKRILAYSSVENMALVMLCLSFAMLCGTGGSIDLVTIVLIAGLLHTINHSVFKALAFMTVGTVEDSTGETAIEKMGGLANVLPVFSFIALIAVLSMAAIPPLNGFASEWMMIQSIMAGEVAGVNGIELILPLGVAVIGISGMMAAVSYARLYGFIFLGRPRSKSVANPKKIGKTSFVPMAALAGLCIVMGIFAIDIMKRLGNAVGDLLSSPFSEEYSGPLLGTLNLPVLAAILVCITVAVYLVLRIRKKDVREEETWDCGTRLEEHMQYSSVGFTGPLVKVFHPLYGDIIDIQDDEDETNSKNFSIRYVEPFVTYLYEPIGRYATRIAKTIGRMQNGNVQTYLGYILITLVVLLLVVGLL